MERFFEKIKNFSKPSKEKEEASLEDEKRRLTIRAELTRKEIKQHKEFIQNLEEGRQSKDSEVTDQQKRELQNMKILYENALKDEEQKLKEMENRLNQLNKE